MGQETAILKLSDQGLGIDEICQELSLPLAIVEEALDYHNGHPPSTDEIALPIIAELKSVEVEDVHDVILTSSNFIASQVLVNLNNPEVLNSLGKASVILGNLSSSTDKLRAKKDNNDRNKFSKFLKP